MQSSVRHGVAGQRNSGLRFVSESFRAVDSTCLCSFVFPLEALVVFSKVDTKRLSWSQASMCLVAYVFLICVPSSWFGIVVSSCFGIKHDIRHSSVTLLSSDVCLFCYVWLRIASGDHPNQGQRCHPSPIRHSSLFGVVGVLFCVHLVSLWPISNRSGFHPYRVDVWLTRFVSV